MAITSEAIARLKSQLLTSGLSQQNNALFQVINQLIDATSGVAAATTTIMTGGSSGGGVTGATYLTENPETLLLPNSRQLIAGAGIQFNDSPSGRRVISSAVPFLFDSGDGEGNDGPPGPQGPAGIPGPVGPTGAASISFFYGYDGEDGEDGLPGLNGPQGFTGLQGGIGPPGLPGIDGNDGEDGDSTFIMNAYLYPPVLLGAVSGLVTEEVQTAPLEGDIVQVSLTKDLELRVKTDMELRDSLQELIKEIREFKELVIVIQGVR
jgi:hypothetical protein